LSTSCKDSITPYLLSRSLFLMVSIILLLYPFEHGLFVGWAFKTTFVKAVTLDDL